MNCEYKDYNNNILIMSDNNYISLKKPQKKKHLQEFLTPIFRINSEESLIRNRKFLKVCYYC